ncbi:MAG: glycosyltransferase [Methylococcaceae bacterium]
MKHPDLSAAIDLVRSSNTPALNICIVAPELLGPVRNSGIGTANTFLAYELAEAGHSVSILFSQCETPARTSEPWLEIYRRRGIEVIVAEEWADKRVRVRLFPNHPPLAMAYTVHNWLSEHSFDLVILTEWQGHGFYALQAKRGGLRFKKTAFITRIHRPSLWHAIHNADLPAEPEQSLTYFMERKSVELADAVISPSAYMLDWVKRHGFNPPTPAFVQPNLLKVKPQQAGEPERIVAVDELVFFGRLEYRKGLVQFCDALDKLSGLGVMPHRVTFLGKFARVGQEHSALYIAQRSQKWSFPSQLLSRMGQSEALDYLAAPGRIAVMPSVADNSPYTVYECLAMGIPLLARDVGGVADLIAAEDQAACLFNDNPSLLARRLATVLAEGALRPRLAFDLEDNRKAWREGLPALVNQICPAKQPKKQGKRAIPWVSVCLTHYNRPKLLRQAVASLLEQDYPNLEVILVDDGSPGKDAAKMLQALEPEFARRDWKILRLENGYLGKARNTAVRAARSDFLLFMDDDNVARPHMVSRFMQVALSSGAELVTTVFEVFSGDKKPTAKTPVVERFLPVGDTVSFSVVANAFGDANSLIRRSLFEKLGGFSEDYGLGHEDLELYVRAALTGAKVSIVTEPLYWYRRNGESMLSTTHAAANRIRSFRPYIDHLPAPLAELAVLAYGLATEQILPQPASEFGLLPADRRRLAVSGPDAPETIAAVTNVLKLMGHGTLAKAIMDDLSRPNVDGQIGITSAETLAVSIISVVRQGDAKQLRKLLAGLGKSSSTKEAIASACFTALAATEGQVTNADIVELLAQRLVRALPDSFEALLTAAKHLLTAGCSSSGLNNLYAALALADADYLRLRPDVAAAVDRKQFSYGLEHYHNHGRKEGIPWPGNQGFTALWPHLAKIVNAGDLPELTVETQTMLVLALKAFKPPG